MPLIYVPEGGLVPLPSSPEGRRVRDRLIKYSETAAFPCFELRRGSLFALGVVGAIQVGTYRISIVPKSRAGSEETDKQFLLNLIRAAGHLGPKHLRHVASVRESSLEPLEAILAELAEDMLLAAKSNFPRRYEEVAVDSQTIRGRIDFQRLAGKVPGTDSTLPIRFSPFTADNVLSRTIVWVAESLKRMSRHYATRAILAEVLAMVGGGVPHRRPSRNEVLTLVLSKYELVWQQTVELARLLVNGTFINPSSAGGVEAFGILFPMELLFERALRRALTQAARCCGLQLAARAPRAFMIEDESGTGFIPLRPDYILMSQDGPALVGDAKWKVLEENARAFKVDRGDIYQMNAYLTRYQLHAAALFLPKLDWMDSGWRRSFRIPSASADLHLVGVDVEGLVSRDASTRSAAEQELSDLVRGIAGRQVLARAA